MNTENKGKLVIISGPSGVGKSTICAEVVKKLKNARLSVSVTTRPRAKTETNGGDYWFISKEEFQQHIENGSLLEYAELFGNLYGTPKDKVEDALKNGQTVILEIDVEGAKKAKLIYPDALMIFILPPNRKELQVRMNNRAREQSESMTTRLERAGIEIAAAWQYYEYMVINDKLDKAVKEVVQIIRNQTGEKQW